MNNSTSNNKLTPKIPAFSAWAFSLGTAVGWGSLVVTANSYLAQSGPLGTVLGLIIGAAIMIIISRNYSYLMQIYPDAGGAYTFSKEVFGYDHGFLTAWFLSLVYLAVLWANATSIPLFVRNFIGPVLQFGKMYTIFGYDVYIGEMLVTFAAIVLIGLLCAKGRKASIYVMTGLVCLFVLCIIIIIIITAAGGSGVSMSPEFVPDTGALQQIVRIAVISPWAFIGFEAISHGTEEFSFKKTRIFRMLVISVVSSTLFYIAVTLLSVTAYPEGYANWFEYISDLGNIQGIAAFPAFYAARYYAGNSGVALLMIALLALIITSLIGNTNALSRLFYALGRDKVLPESFAKLNKQGQPGRAIALIAIISLIITFVGRTAIGWIVDVTTIGAVLIYAFVSSAAYKTARIREDKHEKTTGLIGLILMIAFGIYIIIPNLVSTGTMEKETFFLFIIWSILGFIAFRAILARDKERRFGQSMIVWVALLALVLIVALIWMRQSMIVSNDELQAKITQYYAQMADSGRNADQIYIMQQVDAMESEDLKTVVIAFVLFGISVAMMLTNHFYMNKRTKESEIIANIDPMTGVKSKHAWLLKEKEVNNYIDSGSMEPFAIAVCDVNGLKKINDTLGHKAGDEYICSASQMVCEIFQHSPVYRIGGDEFVLVLTGRDYDSRKILMKQLHDRSIEHIGSGKVVVSGGYSDFDGKKDKSFHEVFERADALMYEEKQLLKGLGSISRDDDEQSGSGDETPSIFNVKREILIVEDEELNRMMLGSVLEDGYEVLYAEDGVEAMEQIRANKYGLALVLLDLMMPRMGGFEVLKAMQSDTELKNIPVIVLTADQESELECLKLGAVDFIPKPYPAFEIIRARVDKSVELTENKDTIKSTERDALTNLYNIDYFMRYVNMYDQHYPDMAMDAIVVDVNSFHMINERYGKNFGDLILSRIGQNLRTIAREIGGVACRQGADTFFLYSPMRDDYEKILDRLSEGLVDDKEFAGRIRLRMGIYAQADKNLEIERRFDRAKMAAEEVKSGYARPIGFYNEKMHENAVFKEKLLENFRDSIENRYFVVYFQPKFNIRPEKPILASAEALVRWNHPEMGMISPADFIPLLEESGLILELDKYVWKETAAYIRSWKDKYGFSVPVSVNVSRIDMLTPNLKNIFTGILEEYNLTADDIMLEITESAYAGDSEQVISTAKDLRGMGMGFRIEMDDFGTGYSSLGMLTQLPIDALKLDMTFVRNAFGETRDVRMIELIIDIADYLHVPVVAEGVETEEQLLVLKALGCDLVQGYYLSRPVPGDEFDRFLLERKAQSLEVTREARKSYLSFAKALSSDFESIYYVDILTDYYLEFYNGPGGELQIRPGGDDFFDEAKKKIMGGVCQEDMQLLDGILSKEHIKDPADIYYRKEAEEGLQTYHLQSVRTRNNDDHHVVIGINHE